MVATLQHLQPMIVVMDITNKLIRIQAFRFCNVLLGNISQSCQKQAKMCLGDNMKMIGLGCGLSEQIGA